MNKVFNNLNYGIIGKGVGFKVLSTVMDIAKRELELRPKTKALVFSAENSEPSRVRAYNKIVSTLVSDGSKYAHYIESDKSKTIYVIYKKD